MLKAKQPFSLTILTLLVMLKNDPLKRLTTKVLLNRYKHIS